MNRSKHIVMLPIGEYNELMKEGKSNKLIEQELKKKQEEFDEAMYEIIRAIQAGKILGILTEIGTTYETNSYCFLMERLHPKKPPRVKFWRKDEKDIVKHKRGRGRPKKNSY